MGRLELSHRRHVHHGSSGLHVHDCRLGVIQEGALSVDTQMDDEFVEVTERRERGEGRGGGKGRRRGRGKRQRQGQGEGDGEGGKKERERK